jgi:hypothetical protein
MSVVNKDIIYITVFLLLHTETMTLTPGPPKHNHIKDLLKYLLQTKVGYIMSTVTKDIEYITIILF